MVHLSTSFTFSLEFFNYSTSNEVGVKKAIKIFYCCRCEVVRRNQPDAVHRTFAHSAGTARLESVGQQARVHYSRHSLTSQPHRDTSGGHPRPALQAASQSVLACCLKYTGRNICPFSCPINNLLKLTFILNEVFICLA